MVIRLTSEGNCRMKQEKAHKALKSVCASYYYHQSFKEEATLPGGLKTASKMSPMRG
jgi:hypothetical protein